MQGMREPAGGAGADPRLPAGLRVVFGFAIAGVILSAATLPWRVGSLAITRSTVPLGLAAILCAASLCVTRWRRALFAFLRDRRVRVPPSVVAALALAFTLLLGRVLLLRFASLELNASDMTLYYDRPLEQTLHGRLMYCSSIDQSLFAMHGSYLILAFLPLYVIGPSPLWLLAAHVLALAAAFAAAYALFRLVLNDALAALLLAAAYPLHSNTVSALQYGFHIEVFYPLGVFLLVAAFLRRRPAAFAVAGALIALVKEDGILVLGGVALSILLGNRRMLGWALSAAGLGAASFLVTAYLVLPHFSGSAPGKLWYLSRWSDYGHTPAAAAAGILTRPARLVSNLAGSGAPGLLEPLLATPLAGGSSLIGCLPALVVYGSSDWEGISGYGTHYGLPVLPLVFVAAASGIRRLSRYRLRGPRRPILRLRRRLAAACVLAACAVDGGGYVFLRAHPAQHEIASTLAALGDRPVRIQGSLYPHAGYAASRRYLDRTPGPGEAVLVAPGTNPFPLTPGDLAALVGRLSSDPGYRRSETPGGLLLFTPAAPAQDGQ